MNLSSPKNILIIEAGRIGDTLISTPLLKLVKKYKNDIEIDIVCIDEKNACIFENCPYLDRLIIGNVAPEKEYDLCIAPIVNSIAVDYIKKHELSCFTVPEHFLPETAIAERLLLFFSSLFRVDLSGLDRSYELFPSAIDKKNALNLISGSKSSSRKLIGVHLGCQRISDCRVPLLKRIMRGKYYHGKVWSVNNFISLASIITKKHSDVIFIVTGTKNESELANLFLSKIKNSISIVNKTTILELREVISQLDAFITGDTCPLHVACVSNVALVALFGGQTSYQVTGPYPVNKKRIVLYDCDDIDNINPRDVASVIDKIVWN